MNILSLSSTLGKLKFLSFITRFHDYVRKIHVVFNLKYYETSLYFDIVLVRFMLTEVALPFPTTFSMTNKNKQTVAK